MSTCGDFGGLTPDGTPCGRLSNDGMCSDHQPDAVSTSERQKNARQDAFLAAYAQTGNITAAALKAGVSRGAHHLWMKEDPGYLERFEETGEEAADRLVAEARRRAVLGVEEPVGWYKGVAGGTVRKYSDTLLMFLIKKVRPEYRESFRHEVTGKDGKDFAPSVHIYLPHNGRDQLPDAIRERMAPSTNGSG